jgi:N-acetylmuramoyl-L-alanine amidase
LLIRCSFFMLFLFPLSHKIFSQNGLPISLIYPHPNSVLSTFDSVIVLGQVHVKDFTLTINDVVTTTSDDGAFINFIKIDPGKISSDSNFILTCRAVTKDSTYTLERTVKIPVAPKVLDSNTAALDTLSLSPKESRWLQTGDRIDIACRATPRAAVSFSVLDSLGNFIEKDLPMAEAEKGLMDNFGDAMEGVGKKSKRPTVPGMYIGTYTLDAGAVYKKSVIRFKVSKNGKQVFADAPGRISGWDNTIPKIIELKNDYNNATVAPSRAYYYFLPKGIRAEVNGRIGSQLRLNLSEHHAAWISENNVIPLPAGTPYPETAIPVVRVKREGQHTVIKLFMSEKIPFVIHQTSEKQMQLLLFGGVSDTDWIRYENKDDEIESVKWSQPENHVYQLTVHLKHPHTWGYEAYYDGTNFVWTIHHKPKTHGLKGLKICVDPGHSKDWGATGPRGNTEKQVNVEVALKLKKELESEGATVVMTHSDTSQNVSLYERVTIANTNRCDLFVSIHHNAQPDGVSPFGQNFGPSVIYYHPQSKRLAELIQASVIKKTKLNDFGVFQGNIAVCRNAQMPAVLVECAFLVIPDQEKLIVSEKFQKRVAQAIKDGIKEFVKRSP